MTGATGFLGKHLLEAMLQDSDDQFYLLVRSPQAAGGLFERLPSSAVARIQVLYGDITLPHLGLSSDQLSPLVGIVHEVWHLAASTYLDWAKHTEVAATNVTGTQNVLAVSRWFRRLDHFYLVGTAFACGYTHDLVPETALPPNLTFRNPYEQSKYYAELLTRESGLPFTIIRPSLIAGDSRTGDAGGLTSSMLYRACLALYYALLRTFKSEASFWRYWASISDNDSLDVDVRLYGHSDASKNLVTINDVVTVCLGIRQTVSEPGTTYNLVNPQTITAGTILTSMTRAFRVAGLRLEPHPSLIDPTGRNNATEKLLFRHMRPYWPYLISSDPRWKSDNVARLGLDRVEMTPGLCDFLIRSYVHRHLRSNRMREHYAEAV
jgi:nucleoside-diphosphate-sugar epimerase